MPSIDTYRKQAKRLVRWHGERNFSVGEKVRLVERYRHLGDEEALALAMPLALAQEIVAVEAGFEDWPGLRKGVAEAVRGPAASDGEPALRSATPILFVSDVARAADFYTRKLGFEVDFLHGKPPFYGSVTRDGLALHLRYVRRTNFLELAGLEAALVLALIEVTNAKALFDAFAASGVEFAQKLVRQPWGGIDFHVRDPDGNAIAFVEYGRARADGARSEDRESAPVAVDEATGR
jgi:uncharacterized glyoxalase superfamily protein PhnB